MRLLALLLILLAAPNVACADDAIFKVGVTTRVFVPAGGANILRSVAGDIHLFAALAKNQASKEVDRLFCGPDLLRSSGLQEIVASLPEFFGHNRFDGIQDPFVLGFECVRTVIRHPARKVRPMHAFGGRILD